MWTKSSRKKKTKINWWKGVREKICFRLASVQFCAERNTRGHGHNFFFFRVEMKETGENGPDLLKVKEVNLFPCTPPTGGAEGVKK